MLSSSELLHHNFQTGIELKKVVSSENLTFYKGFGMSPNVKLFVFKEQPGVFSINLISQTLRDDCIAIVPPGQLHFLSPVECSDFICIEVPKNLLMDEDFDFMTRLIYSTQKHLDLGKMAGFDYDQFKIFLSNENNHQLNLQLLKNKIEKAYPNQFGSTKTFCDAHFELANNFDSLIKQIECFTLEHTVVRNYAEKLNCTERTLNRACEKVFRVSPQDILKHYLLLRSIHLLFNEQNLPHLIAEKLGYSTINAFMKFVKAQTSLSPNKIKKKFQEEGLRKIT
jgi:AraC-like DNA-binding protein